MKKPDSENCQIDRAARIQRELAEEAAPIGDCAFCGERKRPVVMSEVNPIAICEECADGAICQFLTRSSLLAPIKRKARR